VLSILEEMALNQCNNHKQEAICFDGKLGGGAINMVMERTIGPVS
jgi:hypothetical protein